MSTTKIVIGGKTYDLEDPSDLAKVQATLVPANWPTNKKDCVRLFLATLALVQQQLGRHLAFNWKNLCKIAQEEAADGSPARVPVGFAFEIDQSALTVAALSSIKMSYSAKFSTKGKPQTLDMNQTDFLSASGESVDLDALSADMAPEPEEEKPEEKKGDDTGEEGKGAKRKRGGKKSTKAAESAE